MKNVRDSKVKYTAKVILPPPGLRKPNPRPQGSLEDAPAKIGGENCVLVVGKSSNYYIHLKQARYLLRKRLAIKLSSKPFIICEPCISRQSKDDMIIEKVFSCLVSRKHREHRDELIYQVSKARTGKPRKAYIEPFDDSAAYVPLPYAFGRGVQDGA